MENEQTLKEKLNLLAREIRDNERSLYGMRKLPALQHAVSMLDVRGYVFTESIVDLDNDTEREIEDENENENSNVFESSIPAFSHTVRLPLSSNVKRESAARLRPHEAIVRKCFVILLEYCHAQKHKRQGLINALLLWRSKALQNSMTKWKVFVAECRTTLLQKCFTAWWIHFIQQKKVRAIINQAKRRKTQTTLKKILLAWKWFVPAMRRERARQFFIENRHNLLSKAHWFEKWLTSFQRSVAINALVQRDKERILVMCLREWRAFATRSKFKRIRVQQVSSYYNYNHLSKFWRNWKLFTVQSVQKKRTARRAVAQCLVKFCFNKWVQFVSFNQKMTTASNVLAQKVAVNRRRYYLLKWQSSLYATRAQLAALIKFILKRHFRKWKSWTKARRQSRLALHYLSLRFFRRWYSHAYEKQHNREIEQIAHRFYFHRTVPRITQKSVNIWKKYVAYRKYKKKLFHDAAVYYVGYLMPKKFARCIAAWKDYTVDKKQSRMLDKYLLQQWDKIKLRITFTLIQKKYMTRKIEKEKEYLLQSLLREHLRKKYLRLLRLCIRKWRAHVLSIAFYKASLATSHFTKTMLEKCFLAWAKFTKQKLMKYIASAFYCNRKLRNGLEHWKRTYTEQRIKWRIAQLYNKKQLLSMAFSGLLRYHSIAKQAMELRLYPLINKRENKIKSKAFLLWTRYVRDSITKRDFDTQAVMFWIFHQLSLYFRKWKDFCRKTKRLRNNNNVARRQYKDKSATYLK